MGSIHTTTDLFVTRCWCGVEHAVPKSLHDVQLRKFNDGGTPTTIYCPLGHGWVPAGEPRTKALERQLASKQAAFDQERAARAEAEAQLEAAKKKARRVAKGVCPCCSRSFTNLRRHMATKHPNEARLPSTKKDGA